jgi:hypothetical protein
MTRRVVCMLSAMVVVTATLASGCGSGERPQLERWASDVCTLFSEHETNMRVIFDGYETVEKAPQLATPSMMLPSLREGRRAGREFAAKLDTLQPPKPVARLWRQLIGQQFILQDPLTDLDQIETELEALPADASRLAIERHVDQVGAALAQLASAPGTIAQYVGLARRIGKGELTQAFKDADSCKPFAEAIAAGESVR